MLKVQPVQRFQCGRCGCKVDAAGAAALTRLRCPSCQTLTEVPGRVDHNILLTVVSRLGHSTVYRAMDGLLQRRVLMRILGATAGQEAARDAFSRAVLECARKQAAIVNDRVAPIYRIGEHEGHPYVVSALMEPTSASLLAQGPLTQPQALDLAIDVAEALVAASRQGLIHGDLRPDTIALDAQGRAVISDLGLSILDPRRAERGYTGHPAYIAPEAAIGQTPDTRCDVYSLGATLFHWLCARPPFPQSDPEELLAQKTSHRAPPIDSLRADLASHTVALVDRLLALQPSVRPQDPQALLAELRTARQAVDIASAVAAAGDPAAALAATQLSPALPAPMPAPTPDDAPIPGAAAALAGAISSAQSNASKSRRAAASTPLASSRRTAPRRRPAPLALIVGVPLGMGLVLALVAVASLLKPSPEPAPPNPPQPAPITPTPSPQQPPISPPPPAPSPPEPAVDLASGLLAHWSFEALDAGFAPDTTGEWRAKAVGQPQLSPGKRGRALKLDGQSSLQLPQFQAKLPQATFALWLQPEGPQRRGTGLLFSRPNTKLVTGLNIQDGTPTYAYHWSDARETWAWTQGPAVEPNTWQFVAAVVRPQDATLHRWTQAKGLISATNRHTHAPLEIQQLHIGADPLSPGNRIFKGLLDEARIYNRALTRDEILALILLDR